MSKDRVVSVVSALALLAIAGCSDAVPPTTASPVQKDSATAIFSFGAPVSDAAIKAFVSKYHLAVTGYQLYSAGLYGQDGGVLMTEAISALPAVRQRIVDASALATTSIYVRRDSLRAQLGSMPDDEVAEAAARMLDLLESHQAIQQAATGNQPLVWSIRARGPKEEIDRATKDGSVVMSNVQGATSSSALGSLIPSLPSFDMLHPAVGARKQEALEWVRGQAHVDKNLPIARSVSALPTADAPQWYPTQGQFFYDGARYFSVDASWANPGAWPTLNGLALEIDLTLSSAFFLNAPGLGCVSWTTLPGGYDDCPTAGTLDGIKSWTYSVGSNKPLSILAGTTYHSEWAFWGLPAASSSDVIVGAQQNHNASCPWTDKWWDIWCMESGPTVHLISELAGIVVKKGTITNLWFNTRKPAISGVSPAIIPAGTSTWVSVSGQNLDTWIQASVNGARLSDSDVEIKPATGLRVRVTTAASASGSVQLTVRRLDGQSDTRSIPIGAATSILTILGAGSGSGAVTGSGMSCIVTSGSTGSGCTASYNTSTTVQLTATPATGSTFSGWSGSGCSSTSSCSLSMSQPRTVTATFAVSAQPPVAISVSASPVNSGAVTGGNTYPLNSTVTVTASPASGYTFLRWTENGSQASPNASYTFTATASRNLVAVFQQNAPSSYTISANPSPANGGSVAGYGSYFPNATVSLIALPATGYSFTNWTENGSVVSPTASYSFPAIANRSLTANFTQTTAQSYAISVSASPSNGGTAIGNGTYVANSTATVTAQAAAGYTFVRWTENGTTVSTSSSYGFPVTGTRSLVAVFSQNAATSYSISAGANPSNGGTVSGAGSYTSGSSVTVSATPSSGYTFTSWTENGGVVSQSANYSFTVSASRSLTANFAQTAVQSHSISVSASPSKGGTVNGGGSYPVNGSITVTAQAASGYSFSRWTENGSQVSTNTAYSFTVTGPRNLVAVFTQNVVQTYTIGVSASPSSGGTAIGGGSFSLNTTISVIATPASGYVFSKWTENGTTVSTNATYLFAVSASRNLVANFTAAAPTIYSIGTSASPFNGGNTSGGGTFVAGTSVNLLATPASGYSFVRWRENGSQVATSTGYTIVANANRSFVAEFTQNLVQVSASASPSNGGSILGPGMYPVNTALSVTASPSTGYSFVRWTENGNQVSTSAVYTFTATTARTLVAVFAASVTKPSAPSGLAAASTSFNIVLAWNDNSNNETSFEIDRALTNGGSFVTIGSAPANNPNYFDQTTTLGVSYSYCVRAVNAGGSSSGSCVVQAMLPESPVIVTPGSYSSPGPTITTKTPTLSWNAVSGATSYDVAIRDMTTGSLVYAYDVGNITYRTLPSGVLVSGHSYRWDARATRNGVSSVSSPNLYFKVQ